MELEKLQKHFPERASYYATQGGLEAGIVERIGSFLCSITYGAITNSSIEAFDSVLKLTTDVPVTYNEYAVALSRLDKKDFLKYIRKILQICTQLNLMGAEEALNQMLCQSMLKQSNKGD